MTLVNPKKSIKNILSHKDFILVHFSGVTRVYFCGRSIHPGQLLLVEILLGGHFCKIGGKYEIERKRKKRGTREIGEASAQGRYQSMKQ